LPVVETVSIQQPQAPAEPMVPVKTDGLSKEVAAVVDQIVSDFPDDPEAHLACGAVFDNCGKADEAIQCWKNCLSIDPTSGQAHDRIGVILHRRGEFEEAADHLKKARELSPELPDAGARLGKTLLDLGRTEEAIAVLEVEAPKNQRNEEWFWLGQAHFQLKHYKEAKECYEKCLALDTEATAGWFGLAQVCDRLGETERAQRCRERFRQLDDERSERKRSTRSPPPTDEMAVAHACLLAGNVYARQGRPQQAQAWWRKAAALNPQEPRSREFLAKALIKEGRSDEALLVMEELQLLQPENVELLLLLANLYEKTQNYTAVEQCLQEAVQIVPDDPRINAKLAHYYLDRSQKLPEARVLAERAARVQPTGENFFLLSAVCLANQDRHGAKEALIAALRIDPRNPKYIESARVLGEN